MLRLSIQHDNKQHVLKNVNYQILLRENITNSDTQILALCITNYEWKFLKNYIIYDFMSISGWFKFNLNI